MSRKAFSAMASAVEYVFYANAAVSLAWVDERIVSGGTYRTDIARSDGHV